MQSSDEKRKPASIPEALEILETRKKDGDLGYEQQLSYDHAKRFALISSDKAEKMRKELEELNLSPKTCVSIVDTMPTDIIQLKQILANEKNPVEEGVAEKAFALVEKSRGK